MRWSAGEAEVERLLDQGSIERVQGAQADGEIIDAVARLLPDLGFF